jgi:hypothetical protein
MLPFCALIRLQVLSEERSKAMAEDNVVLVTFEEESKAYQAASVLAQADAEGRITLHAVAIVQRMEDGTLRVKEGDVDSFPVATWTATAVGAATGGILGLTWVFWADHWGFSWVVRGAHCWAPWSISTPPKPSKAYWPRWREQSSQARRPSSRKLRSRPQR